MTLYTSGMIKKNLSILFVVLAVLLHCHFLRGQNLMQNGGMEDLNNGTPSDWINMNYYPGSFLVKGWKTATSGSADYYNSKRSLAMGMTLVKAIEGEGRIGFIASAYALDYNDEKIPWDYKEYPMGSLKEPLRKGEVYHFSFFTSLDPRSTCSIDSIGMYISPDPVSVNNYHGALPFRPQIVQKGRKPLTSSDGWVKIEGDYLADGGERYVTIGSFSKKSFIPVQPLKEKPLNVFFPDITTFSYFYIDNVVCTLRNEEEIKKAYVPKNDIYVFDMDISRSMKAGGKMDSLKTAFERILDKMSPSSKIALFDFNNRAHLLLPVTSSKEKDKILKVIRSLNPSGETNFNTSIGIVYDLVEKEKDRVHVIVLTDGVFNVDRVVEDRIKRNYAEKNISFSTLQFGTLPNTELEKISVFAGGKYIDEAEKKLPEKLKNIMFTTSKPSKKKSSRVIKAQLYFKTYFPFLQPFSLDSVHFYPPDSDSATYTMGHSDLNPEANRYFSLRGAKMTDLTSETMTYPYIPLNDKGQKVYQPGWLRRTGSFAPFNVDNTAGLPKKTYATKQSLLPISANYLFLIDVSASMNSDNKLVSVEQTMVDLIRSLPDSSMVSVLEFNSSTHLIQEFKSIGKIKSRLYSIATTLSPDGGTDINMALLNVYHYISTSLPDKQPVYMLTLTDEDGLEELRQRPGKSAIKLFATNNIRLTVLTFTD